LDGKPSGLANKSDGFIAKDGGKNHVAAGGKGSVLKSPDTSLEPDQNLSQLVSDKKPAEDAEPVTEEWVQEELIKLPVDGRLVDYFFLGGKMLCVFDNF